MALRHLAWRQGPRMASLLAYQDSTLEVSSFAGNSLRALWNREFKYDLVWMGPIIQIKVVLAFIALKNVTKSQRVKRFQSSMGMVECAEQTPTLQVSSSSHALIRMCELIVEKKQNDASTSHRLVYQVLLCIGVQGDGVPLGTID